MSIQAVAWALEQDLPARPKLVLVAIANHADHRTGYCWLNAETIAAEASCAHRSVWRFVGSLIRNGYLRREKKRGADGKQRSNDYWITFGRVENPWDERAGLGDDAEIEDCEVADEIGGQPDTAQDTAQDMAPPGDRESPGPSASLSPGESDFEPVDKPVESLGPSDSRVTHKSLDEPSKTNPKEEIENEKKAEVNFSKPPRSYKAPAVKPEPQGAIAHPKAEQIFVYEGSRAFVAWSAHMARKNNLREWNLTCWKTVDGKRRSGWYFPSLFPPATAPPGELSDEDARALAMT